MIKHFTSKQNVTVPSAAISLSSPSQNNILTFEMGGGLETVNMTLKNTGANAFDNFEIWLAGSERAYQNDEWFDFLTADEWANGADNLLFMNTDPSSLSSGDQSFIQARVNFAWAMRLVASGSSQTKVFVDGFGSSVR